MIQPIYDPDEHREAYLKNIEEGRQNGLPGEIPFFEWLLCHQLDKILTPHRTEAERLERALALQWLCEPDDCYAITGECLCRSLEAAGITAIPIRWTPQAPRIMPTKWEDLVAGVKKALQLKVLLSRESRPEACLWCGGPFPDSREGNRTGRKFCSEECRLAHLHREGRKIKRHKYMDVKVLEIPMGTCVVCGKEFPIKRKRTEHDPGRMCSAKCRAAHANSKSHSRKRRKFPNEDEVIAFLASAT